MVEREQVVKIVKCYLPQVKDDVANRISEDIVRNVELITHAMIRRAAARQSQQLYWASLKN